MADDLAVLDVGHRFGDLVALAGVTMNVPPGRLVGLLGPNGAGKSTLMRIMFGVIPPDAGEVLWQGRPATPDDRRSWGYMPQERGLYHDMRAVDQLVYHGRLHGLSHADASGAARRLLADLGLADREHDRTDKLSGGMQQRLQLATALVHDPQVVVLDEPFAGLDPVAVDELSRLLTEFAAAGRTVLVSSHQLDLVQDLCPEIVLLDHGRVVLAGDVAELRAGAAGRHLRLGLDAPAAEWVPALLRSTPGAAAAPDSAAAASESDGRGAVRLQLPPGTDPLAVLDRARAIAPVRDFGLELPTLSELFLAAVEGTEP